MPVGAWGSAARIGPLYTYSLWQIWRSAERLLCRQFPITKSRLLQIAVTHHTSFRLRRRLSTQMSALRPALRGDASSASSASSACSSASATRSFQGPFLGPSSPMPTARRAARPPIDAVEREGSARDPLQFVAMRGPFFGFGRAGGTGLPTPVGGLGGAMGGAEPVFPAF